MPPEPIQCNNARHRMKMDEPFPRITKCCVVPASNPLNLNIHVRKLGNFRYILIPEIINKFMTNISDPVRTKYVHVFKLNLK
jgi:hypothetical protein